MGKKGDEVYQLLTSGWLGLSSECIWNKTSVQDIIIRDKDRRKSQVKRKLIESAITEMKRGEHLRNGGNEKELILEGKRTVIRRGERIVSV